MADGNSGGQERTEQATPRRRARAKDEGRVARSVELSTAAVLLSGTFALAAAGAASLSTFARGTLTEAWSALSFRDFGPGGSAGLIRSVTGQYLVAFIPFAVGVMVVVLAVNLLQAKGVASLQPITPKISNIDPFQGIKRIFSGQSLFQGLKSVLKLAVIGTLVYSLISRTLPELTALSEATPPEIAGTIRHLAVRFAVLLGLAYLVLAAIDYVYQHFQMEKSLRMTRQEVKYEHRDIEGDPHVKSRLLTMARVHARRRMLQNVPDADVVVVNPTQVAVALRYDTAVSPAPVVVAMGQRKLAERIKEIARRAGVAIVENRPVARALLATAKVGQPIPPALYAAVAEILAFVYRRRDRHEGIPAPLVPRSLS